jgi:hypothetical protein
LRLSMNTNAPAWIVRHIAITQWKHLGLALEGIHDIPE